MAAVGEVVVPVSKTKELKGTEKRDTLVAWEKKIQQKWESEKLFQPDAPSTAEVPLHSITPAELREKYPKFYGTIAYPYMNGTLHVGHAFSDSKVEFMVGWERMQGKRVLWPQGYHCTGLPIRASADKIANEVKKFGADFQNYNAEDEVEDEPPNGGAKPVQAKNEDVTKFKATKGKANAKTIKVGHLLAAESSWPRRRMLTPADEIPIPDNGGCWYPEDRNPPLCRSLLLAGILPAAV